MKGWIYWISWTMSCASAIKSAMHFVRYSIICCVNCFWILTTILLLQNLYPSLDLGYSSSFRLFCCWILCMDGMRTGSLKMSSSGWLLAVAHILVELPLVYCEFLLLISLIIVVAGTWLCWLSQLYVTLPRSLSRVFYFTGSLHQDMTVDSTCSSLSSHWFLFLHLLLLLCTRRYRFVACISSFCHGFWLCSLDSTRSPEPEYIVHVL